MLYVSEIELKSLIIRIKNARITNMRKCYVTNADDSEKNILANSYIIYLKRIIKGRKRVWYFQHI